MQRVLTLAEGRLLQRQLPHPMRQIVPGIAWGAFDELFTPAFWVSQAWMREQDGGAAFGLGETLAEELAACLLGSHGMPAEMGMAAYRRVRGAMRQTARDLEERELHDMLVEPFHVGGKLRRYRFAAQRSRQLAAALSGLRAIDEGRLGDVDLRDALIRLPGIGPKTASWIVRNRRASDAVAILDVHIVRACVWMGIFRSGSDPSRHYADLETAFLGFCRAGDVRPSVMDAIMWETMRSCGTALMTLHEKANRTSTVAREQAKADVCREAIRIEAKTTSRRAATRTRAQSPTAPR